MADDAPPPTPADGGGGPGPDALAGAPVPPEAIDPELIRLARRRPHVGLITAAGILLLCALFLLRLGPDRAFAGERPEAATIVSLGDVLADRVHADSFVAVPAEPLAGQAIRANQGPGGIGLRVAPVRGARERLWLVLPGDGWTPPAGEMATGRLRRLDTLPFAAAVRAFAATRPRPRFATVAAARAGFASGQVATVDGDEVRPADGDVVALEVAEPDQATVIATFHERLPDAAAWTAALAAAGLVATGAPVVADGQARYPFAASVASLTPRLEAAGLWAARVEPVTRHLESTWGALRASPPAGLAAGGQVIPDASLDLLGLMIARPLPADAWALVTTERPTDYWYVLPISIALGVLGLVFAWALARAVKRDLLA